MLKLICPQCQGQLTEVLDSGGGLFICLSDFHGKVAPSFTRETLETAQGVTFAPSHPLPTEMKKCICNLEDGIHEWDCPAVKHSHFYREEKHPTEINLQLLSELAEQVESEYEGLLPFTAMVDNLIEKYNAAQQSVQRTCFYCDENKAPAKETICQSCVDLLSDASR